MLVCGVGAKRFVVLSSNANKVGTAVLWCSILYGDGNAIITNGRLLASDPEDMIVNADESKTLRVLWDWQRWNIQYLFNKFLPPTVWNGRVYLPSYNGGVDVTHLRHSSSDRLSTICDVLIPRGIIVHEAGVVQWQNVSFPS